MSKAVGEENNGEQPPTFTTEEEAREFWATHSSAPYFAAMEDVTNTPSAELRPGPGRQGTHARKRPGGENMALISLRLPLETIAALKRVAAQRGLPYQTLMRSWITERLAREAPERQQQTLDLLKAIQVAQQQQRTLLDAVLQRLSDQEERVGAASRTGAEHGTDERNDAARSAQHHRG